MKKVLIIISIIVFFSIGVIAFTHHFSGWDRNNLAGLGHNGGMIGYDSTSYESSNKLFDDTADSGKVIGDKYIA